MEQPQAVKRRNQPKVDTGTYKIIFYDTQYQYHSKLIIHIVITPKQAHVNTVFKLPVSGYPKCQA